MKNIVYNVQFELINKKGTKEERTEMVPSYNANAAAFARKKIENKYRGQGYKVNIISVKTEVNDG